MVGLFFGYPGKKGQGDADTVAYGLVPVGGVFLEVRQKMKESLRANKGHLVIAAELLEDLEVIGKRASCLRIISPQKMERAGGASPDEAFGLFCDQLFRIIKFSLEQELVEKQSLKRESFIIVQRLEVVLVLQELQNIRKG